MDPATETPGRLVLRHIVEGLVTAMEMALAKDTMASQLVAAESVVQAETKDHLNWELIGLLAEEFKGPERKALPDAHSKVEEQEDEHLYHTMGWARELRAWWRASWAARRRPARRRGAPVDRGLD